MLVSCVVIFFNVQDLLLNTNQFFHKIYREIDEVICCSDSTVLFTGQAFTENIVTIYFAQVTEKLVGTQ